MTRDSIVAKIEASRTKLLNLGLRNVHRVARARLPRSLLRTDTG